MVKIALENPSYHSLSPAPKLGMDNRMYKMNMWMYKVYSDEQNIMNCDKEKSAF